MNLKKFLDLSAGRWFSQRTNYLLGGDKADNSKADITIEAISPDDSRATQLCQKHNLDPSLIVGGTVQSWDNSVDVVMACKDDNGDAIASEVADLFYHTLVALAHHNVDIRDVYRHLQSRR